MLDDHDGVPAVHQPLEHAEQFADVLEVQAGRRFVEDVERPARRALPQLRGELHSLGFSAREGGRWLSEPDIAEADIEQRSEHPGDLRLVLEERQGLLDRHVEDVGDRMTLEEHLEGVPVVAEPTACVARYVHVGQEVHLDPEGPVTLARLASAARDVEREPSRLVPAHSRIRSRGEELADRVEHLRVRHRVGSRGSSDR